MSHKLHNPKAMAPAIYIPSWLSQVPSNKLTPSCKMVYGRLAQWATSEGKAHRSAKQLSEEIGIPERTIEDCLKQLREKLLIGSFLPSDGGHNHFEFYDHPWMHEPINKNLCYKSDLESPPAKSAVPPAKSAVPPAKSAEHKIKEVKLNKKTTTTSKNCGGGSLSKTKRQMLELKCPDDTRDDEDFLNHCDHHIKNNSSDKEASQYKRTMMLICLLKSLLEAGEHFKSKGFIDLDAEKSRVEQEKERERQFREAQDRQHEERLASYKKSSEKAKESKPSQERTGNVRRLSDILKRA